MTAKKCTKKKTWCTCRAAVCQAKPIAFLLSSLPCYCMVTSVAEPLVHVYPAPLIESFLCTRITWGRKAGALSFTASTREKLKVCNSYATCAKYFKARVITFTFKVKRIINTLLIYLIFSSEKLFKSSGCLKTGSGVTASGIFQVHLSDKRSQRQKLITN